MSATTSIAGYLPNDVPPTRKLLILGFQHLLTMFPATVLVPLLIGFDVSAVLVLSGISTVTALLLSRFFTGQFIPLYYGSSFSYIAATLAVTHASFGVYAEDTVRLVQVGFLATGVINIIVGLLVRIAGGKRFIDVLLPPVLTGSVAIIIGAGLAGAALDMASQNWGIAFATMFAAVIFSVFLKNRGFLGLIPILLAYLFGYGLSVALGKVDFDPVTSADIIRWPRFTTPDFGHSRAGEMITAIAIMAIATIPESTAHLYQIGLYVDKLAEKMRRPAYHLSEKIGINLVLDGIGDCINGLFGGVAGTNYGENNSLMVITKNYSGAAILVAGAMAVLLGFSGTLAAIISTIPVYVTGGLAIYLFGAIAFQGIALLISETVDIDDPRAIAIGSIVPIIGIGGSILYGGNIPMNFLEGTFPEGIPAIPLAALVGIGLNLLFLLAPKSEPALPAIPLPDSATD